MSFKKSSENINGLDSNMKVSNSYFTEKDILKKGGIIYDPSRADEHGKMDLPDVSVLIDKVYAMLEYMATDEMVALKETNVEEYEFKIEEKFFDFVSRYYSLFRVIIKGGDLTPLFQMFAYIDSVNKGVTTLEDVEKRLGEDLARDYVKPMEEGDSGEDIDLDDIDLDDEDFDDDVVDGGGKKKKKKKNKNKKKKKDKK